MPDPDDGLHPSDQALPLQHPEGAERYQLSAAAGDGPRKVRDQVLDRGADAVLSADAEALERKARFLARLDHAGAPVVLDFVRSADGAMMVTRQSDGITLAEAMARAAAGMAPPEIATPVAAVVTMLKVCDVAAAAHAQGVVHHAIAPERILLGSHGQVLLLDWEAALAARIRPTTLRYVASGDPIGLAADGLHQDVRALGACLFACLALRPPAPAAGDVLGPVSVAERARVPAPLEAIVRRALDSGPVEGYRSVAQLNDDLGRWLAAQQPVAYAPGRLARLGEWARLRRRPILGAIAIAAVLVVTAGLVAWPRLHAWRTWGAPVISEGFADDAWRQRWIEPPSRGGMFAVRDGRLVSTAERDAILICRRRLTTPVAIEYTGRIGHGSQPCDLSVLWSESSGIEGEPARFSDAGRNYMIQAGAFGNSFCALFRNPGRALMAHANRQLQPERDYRFRVELDGNRITMAIDGETVLDERDAIPTVSGHIALFGFYPGKEFDDVRIWEGRPCNRPDALSAGDEALLAKRFDLAAELYARAAETATGGGLEQRALYRQGLALWYQGRDDLARGAWGRVGDRDLMAEIDCIHYERLFNTDRLGPHQSRFEEQYRASPDQRANLRRTWCTIIQRQMESPRRDPFLIDYFLKLRGELFPDDSTCRFVAAKTLVALNRFQAVLADFPEQRWASAQAMLALGRSAEVIASDWAGTDERFHAMEMRGDLAAVAAGTGALPIARSQSLCKLGRAAETVDDPDLRYPGLLHAGRAADLLLLRPLSAREANAALVCAGKLAEAAGDGLPDVPGSGSDQTALLLLGRVDEAERLARAPANGIRFMQAVEAGDTAAQAALHDRLALPENLNGLGGGWFAVLAARPFCDALQGDPAAMGRQLKPQLPLLEGVYGRRAWFVARALLGEIPPEGVAQMTAASEAGAWRLVVAGMRAELSGDRATALGAYAAFAALPVHRRLLALNLPDPEVEWFVRWRLRELKRTASAPRP